MGMATLRVGQKIRWRDAIFRLEGRSAKSEWYLTETSTGATDLEPEAVLLEAYEVGALRFLGAGSQAPTTKDQELFDTLSNAAQHGATEQDARDVRAAVMRQQYLERTGGLSGTLLEQAIDDAWAALKWPEKRPSSRAVYNWRAKARGSSDVVAALIDQDRLKGRYGDRYPAEVMEIVRNVRDTFFLQKNPAPSVEAALRRVETAVQLRNHEKPSVERLPIPKRRVFERVLREVSAYDVIAKRKGRPAARLAMRFSLGGMKVERILQRVQIDHTRLSIFLLDDDFLPWGRANLTSAIDQKSTSPLGFYLGAEDPSLVSVARAIRASLDPKIALLRDYPEVKNTWDCFGVAETYVVDNGLEMHSAALRQAASQLGAQCVEFCATFSGWQKAQVERHFRTGDTSLLQTLPGATMENILTRTDFNPKRDLLLRISTFRKAYMRWLVDIYMQQPKETLDNRTPAEEWRRNLPTAEIVLASNTMLLEQLFFRRVENRVVDHEGIVYDSVPYNSAEVGVLRSQLGARLSNATILVSDEDLGFIYLAVPGHAMWLKVPAVDQDYASGRTRWQHGKCKQMRKQSRLDGRDISLAQADRDIQELIASDAEALSAHRRARDRFRERPGRRESGVTSSPENPSGKPAPIDELSVDKLSGSSVRPNIPSFVSELLP